LVLLSQRFARKPWFAGLLFAIAAPTYLFPQLAQRLENREIRNRLERMFVPS